MKVVFSKLAKQELVDAVHFYELEYSGLGEKFKREIEKTILRIAKHPEAWSIDNGDVRKCLLYKFPYKLLYSIEKDHIFVIAIAHQHRKPDYWMDDEDQA